MAAASIDGSGVREHRQALAAQAAAQVSDLGAVKLVEAGEHGPLYILIRSKAPTLRRQPAVRALPEVIAG
jgi:hypothetical protein